jgi:hypothetical protein
MRRPLALSTLPLFLLTSAIVACSGAAPSSSSQPTTTTGTSTASLAIGACVVETAAATSNGADDKATADGTCRARGLALSSFSEATAVAQYSCCKTAPTPIESDGGTISGDGGSGGGPGTDCEVTSLGSPTSSADPGTWKDDATKTCELDGLTLGDFSVADPSGGGDYRFAKITCCGVVRPPTICACPDEPVATPGVTTNGNLLPTPVEIDGGVAPVLPPVCSCPTPPPVNVCEGGGFGNASGTCTSTADAFKIASSDCSSQGLQLTDFQPQQGDCSPGSVQSASFECCAAAPPVTPPPPACEEAVFTNAKGTCTSLADAQTAAAAACKAQGQVVADFTGDEGSCPSGEIQSGSYSCCGSEVVGPPIEADASAPIPKQPITN